MAAMEVDHTGRSRFINSVIRICIMQVTSISIFLEALPAVGLDDIHNAPNNTIGASLRRCFLEKSTAQ